MAARATVLDNAFADPDLPARARRMQPIAYRNLHIGNALQWLSIGNYRQAIGALRLALRTGANPVTTLVRTLWSVLLWFGFARHAATMRLANGWRSRVHRRPVAPSKAETVQPAVPSRP